MLLRFLSGYAVWPVGRDGLTAAPWNVRGAAPLALLAERRCDNALDRQWPHTHSGAVLG